ncbi:MAG: class II aldolase/adducin family protein, partial [Burkholderiales bacterium]|nr:class II aldolase/adducin family protein [Burkholderiales bacterium]
MNARSQLDIPSMQSRVAPQEWAARVDLAACYRLVADFGWDDLVFTHISARVPGTEDQFLINPYGLMFEEITASSLIKVDSQGNKLEEFWEEDALGVMPHFKREKNVVDVAAAAKTAENLKKALEGFDVAITHDMYLDDCVTYRM